MKNILAMILAGGRVDELDVLTFYRPKSVMPFGGLYRIIDFPLSNLAHSGIEKVGILSQYRPRHLIEHISNGASWDMTGRNRFVTILPPFKGREMSDWYQGTADAVFQNLDFIRLHEPQLVLILSGDHIYRMDYGDLIRFHLENKADLTIAFAKVPNQGAHRFGLGRIDEKTERGGRLLEYVEKPEIPVFEWASLTIYVFTPQVLVEALNVNSAKKSHEFGRDVIPELLRSHKVYGYTHRGYWGYTRTLIEYWQANMDLLGRNPSLDVRAWKVMTNISHRNIRDRQPAIVGASAEIENSLFYGGCSISGRVRNSILFPGVRIDDGAQVEDSILFFDTVVQKGSRIVKTISDVEVVIGKGAKVGRDPSGSLTVIGRGAALPEGVKLSEGVTVFPNLQRKDFTKKEYKPGDVVR